MQRGYLAALPDVNRETARRPWALPRESGWCRALSLSIVLLVASKASESAVKQGLSSSRVGRIYFPGKDAVTTGPGSGGAVGQDRCRRGGDRAEDDVHIPNPFDFLGACWGIDTLLQNCVEQEAWVGGSR